MGEAPHGPILHTLSDIGACNHSVHTRNGVPVPRQRIGVLLKQHLWDDVIVETYHMLAWLGGR